MHRITERKISEIEAERSFRSEVDRTVANTELAEILFE
jgi:hypothetical protein